MQEMNLVVLSTLMSNRVKLELKMPTFVVMIDQTKQDKICLLLVVVAFSAWLQASLSYLLVVVEMAGCFSGQKELLMQKVLFSCVQVVDVEIVMIKAILPGDCLIDRTHRFYTMYQEVWKTCMQRITNLHQPLP